MSICGATDTFFFGLLVTSPLGFKARVPYTVFELDRGIHIRYDARPLPVYNARIAANRLSHMCISAEVG